MSLGSCQVRSAWGPKPQIWLFLIRLTRKVLGFMQPLAVFEIATLFRVWLIVKVPI